MKIVYTEYVDGKIIPVGEDVIYKGKMYKMEKLSTGEVKMNCRGMGFNTDACLILEEIIKESLIILLDITQSGYRFRQPLFFINSSYFFSFFLQMLRL